MTTPTTTVSDSTVEALEAKVAELSRELKLARSPESAMYTAEDVARLFNVHPGTVRRWIVERRVPHTIVAGSVIRFTQEQLAEIRESIGTGAKRKPLRPSNKTPAVNR